MSETERDEVLKHIERLLETMVALLKAAEARAERSAMSGRGWSV
jgi:hypothetical protein